MPARASKKKDPTARRTAAGTRRSGRPRAATAASKIYSDLRVELVSLQRRPGEAISEAPIALSYGVSRTPVREAILKFSTKACSRSIRSPASSSRAFRSPHSPRPSSSARRWRKPPRGSPRNARRQARYWRCSRSWNGSARPVPPETATRSIRPTKCFMLQSPMSPAIPGSLEVYPAGEGPRRPLSPADPAPARADRKGDRRTRGRTDRDRGP